MVAVISHGGYRDATVDRVLEQAHVGWPEFTRLFEDLDDCFLATLEAGIDCAVANAERAAALVDAGADAETLFAATLDGLLEPIARNPQLAHLCLVESAALGARAIEHKEAGLQRFVALTQQALKVPNGNAMPALAAEMVAGGIYEVLQRKARSRDLDNLRSMGPELRQLWAPVIRAAARAL